ncbi:MAG TPA: hypothetical protein VK446_16300 [Methylocystis sp.]|nr:hypothetical protein [Methylocystis sp.]
MKKLSNRRMVAGAAFLGAFIGGFGTALAVSQPHTEAALRYLQQALAELQIADQDHSHGGHDGKATELVNQAIEEVNLAIQYRNTH